MSSSVVTTDRWRLDARLSRGHVHGRQSHWRATCVGMAPMTAKTFQLRFDAPWRWLLRAIGVRRGGAQVELTDDGRLVAIYGPFSVETTIENIKSVQRTGPYRWWRAIGPRASLADKGFTFGTSSRAGICLCFEEWLESGYVRGGRMESLTVTVDDPAGLARALEARGVGGEDLRRR